LPLNTEFVEFEDSARTEKGAEVEDEYAKKDMRPSSVGERI